MKSKKFNVIDVLIVLVLVAALALTAVSLLRKNTAAPEVEGEEQTEVTFRFTVRADEVPDDLTQSILASLEQTGDDFIYRRIYNSDALQTAEITQWRVEPGETGNTIYFTIEAADRITGVENHVVGTQEVRLGKSYLVKTLDIEIQSTVCSMEKLHG